MESLMLIKNISQSIHHQNRSLSKETGATGISFLVAFALIFSLIAVASAGYLFTKAHAERSGRLADSGHRGLP